MTNGAPLTKDDFHSWRMDEFVPHVKLEEKNEERIIKVEYNFVWWNRIFSGIMAALTLIGGYLWNEKSTQIHELQQVAIANQKAIERIGATQQGVLTVLEQQRNTDKEQMTLLIKLVEKMK